MSDAARTDGVARMQRAAGGILIACGVLLAVLSIVSGAHHIHGYGDLFSFMFSLVFAVILACLGWRALA